MSHSHRVNADTVWPRGLIKQSCFQHTIHLCKCGLPWPQPQVLCTHHHLQEHERSQVTSEQHEGLTPVDSGPFTVRPTCLKQIELPEVTRIIRDRTYLTLSASWLGRMFHDPVFRDGAIRTEPPRRQGARGLVSGASVRYLLSPQHSSGRRGRLSCPFAGEDKGSGR